MRRLIFVILSLVSIFAHASEIVLTTRRVSNVDGNYILESPTYKPEKTALIVIDPTDLRGRKQPPGYTENINNCLKPLIELCRKDGILVIYAAHGAPIDPLVAPRSGDFVLRKDYVTGELKFFLKRKGITNLWYAGYATNMCVMTRPSGIIAMHKEGFPIVLFRDCTIAGEAAATAKQQEAKNGVITMIELAYGVTTTLQDLRQAGRIK